MLDLDLRRGLWKQFLIGTLLIVVASASATAVAAFREVDRVVDALEEGNELELGGELAEADAGKPQTIMVMGSDKRPNDPRIASPYDEPRSDTVMLVRLDPSKGATAVMSLPRDLKVDIPGHGTDKLNAAYAIGGPKLTLRTVKALTGLRINHVVNVDFEGFRKAVAAIGCVYMDIDRRYFNDNQSGGELFAEIDIPPGYQRMCGDRALSYVRYRHEDTDLVRSARQQEFLREVKQQIKVLQLFRDRDKLVKIFGRYASSDIRSRAAVLRLAKLALASADQPIREIHFEGQIGASYVTASSAKVRKLAQQFLGVEETRGPRGRSRPRPVRRPRARQGPGLEDAAAPGRTRARQVKRAGGSFPVYYPSLLTNGSSYAERPRLYTILSPDGERYQAYRMVVRRGLVGEYYGLQGTTWRDPPILEDPSEELEAGGRRFELHYDGDRLRLVAWRTDRGVYWVSNTLLQTLTKQQMLGIARSTRAL